MSFSRAAVVIASLFSAAVGQANAGIFFSDKADWEGIPESAQYGYAMGIWDGIMSLSNTPETDAYFHDLNACVDGLELTSKHFAEAINKEYEILENWGYPPIAVLLAGLRKVCLPSINAARSKRGEDPLLPLP